MPSVFGGDRRIDFVYCTKALYEDITSAQILWDDYTTPVETTLSNFCRPSDHLPIIVDFSL